MTPIRRIQARCPRCRGRLLLEQDAHGAYLTCLMCGCIVEERDDPPATSEPVDLPTWWRTQSA
jgi:hypothetical protein